MPTENETWNTCPDCGKRWKDEVATPQVLHRTRLCDQCKIPTPNPNDDPIEEYRPKYLEILRQRKDLLVEEVNWWMNHSQDDHAKSIASTLRRLIGETAELARKVQHRLVVINPPPEFPEPPKSDDWHAIYSNNLTRAREEIERLKRGDFTPEEFQNLCHNLHKKTALAKVGNLPQVFCDGCEDYQKKLFGFSPITKLRDAGEVLWAVLANVSGGDWSKQPQDWRDAAAKARDRFHEAAGPARKVEVKSTETKARGAEEWDYHYVERFKSWSIVTKDRRELVAMFADGQKPLLRQGQASMTEQQVKFVVAAHNSATAEEEALQKLVDAVSIYRKTLKPGLHLRNEYQDLADAHDEAKRFLSETPDSTRPNTLQGFEAASPVTFNPQEDAFWEKAEKELKE